MARGVHSAFPPGMLTGPLLLCDVPLPDPAEMVLLLGQVALRARSFRGAVAPDPLDGAVCCSVVQGSVPGGR
jgi:hypothetical protein